MKKNLSLLLALMLFGVQLPNQADQPEATPIVLEEDGGHKFGGKKAQNRHNRRTRRINRKNGVGLQFPKPAENWDWMLPKIDWEKGGIPS